MRCGIFVKIRGGALAMFVPFANDRYTNTWAGEMEFDSADGSMEAYYEEKHKVGRIGVDASRHLLCRVMTILRPFLHVL